MAERLPAWPIPLLDCAAVREMAELGMSAREIAEMTDSPIASVLSAAPDCFEPEEPEEPELRRCGCGRTMSAGAGRCRRCREEDAHEFADRVRILQATGAETPEIAQVLGVSESKIGRALNRARREGLHRQKRPTIRRR